MPIDANAAVKMTKKPERVLHEQTREELEVIRKLITDNFNRAVPYQYRSEYIAMLMARQHFFSADNLDLGFTDLEQHTIDLKDKDPVFSLQFRLPAEHLKLIQENVSGCPSDRPFTAFPIPGKGQYHWKTCPQGLMGAPSSFSRLMDVLLADAENVITYIDDVLVHSRSHEEHSRHLSAAIDKIGAANLRLNPKKCVFGSDSVEYLGHTLSGDGVRPGQNKAKAMQTAQPPRSVKELRSFCGLANYF
jgi:hypothetical protein